GGVARLSIAASRAADRGFKSCIIGMGESRPEHYKKEMLYHIIRYQMAVHRHCGHYHKPSHHHHAM
ncbi:MAG: hypothetical protein RMI32_08460, partial [Candidatus Nitrosocaldus sp.]|nr:hypothetical protein [Candidatus Nitrosocaldus sp.]